MVIILVCRVSEIDRNEPPTETTLRQLRRSFYTNISDTYMENITQKVIPLTGLVFEEEKDIYHVKVLVLPSR